MQDNKNLGSSIWKWLKFTVKWLWLLAMFVMGLAFFALLPIVVFEYSYSLSELDLVETIFIVLLVMFAYHYIKLCRRTEAPFIRKVITPWVHQAYLLLVFVLLGIVAVQFSELEFDDFETMPLMDFVSYVLMSMTLLYSYKRMNKYPGKQVIAVEAVGKEGAVE
ncbi:hypothetical protein QNE77_004361 [Vibrio alginolyticus]|uniref:hypothetical protein n=1 Tax=Vibrio TaxID=662 RepID=UPI001B836935|nr:MULTISPECIES: hypothetical protein [Vibrio]EHZ2751329.1 hypothetical protein [Vibrio parahaemolyticus]EJA7360742.1 hypothetical protein [Vibrio alginolyticus]ELB2929680.1 hypothetical protein [Vibrio alginolyticus]MBS9989636.1 hypothetical protein [Vibrio alginolyticus]MBT0008180.1 hypothetical protein [Vibrio alginolyticus]